MAEQSLVAQSAAIGQLLGELEAFKINLQESMRQCEYAVENLRADGLPCEIYNNYNAHYFSSRKQQVYSLIQHLEETDRPYITNVGQELETAEITAKGQLDF